MYNVALNYEISVAVFAKIGRVACEGVTRSAIKSSMFTSFDFVINRFFMKLFTAKSIENVKRFHKYFRFSLPTVLWAKRVFKF